MVKSAGSKSAENFKGQSASALVERMVHFVGQFGFTAVIGLRVLR